MRTWRGVLIRRLFICGALLVPGTVLGLSAGQKSRKPASKTDIIGLLEAGVSPKEVEAAVKEYGVSFELTRQTEAELRDAGATDELIRAIRAAAPRHSVTPTRPPAANPPPSSPPVLLIESTPGGAQVYVDDEPIATTSPEGRLKLSTLAPGQHRIRLSLQGRRDFEQTVQLTPGETTTLPVALEVARAEPPPAPSPQRPSGTPTAGPSAPPQPQPQRPSLLTFTVAHDHGAGAPQPNYCVGVMAIGTGIVHYRSTNGVHSFDFPAAEIKEIKKNSVYLANLSAFHIRLRSNHVFNFVVVNPSGQYQSSYQILNVLHQAIGK